jgi:hypothetical protein
MSGTRFKQTAARKRVAAIERLMSARKRRLEAHFHSIRGLRCVKVASIAMLCLKNANAVGAAFASSEVLGA